jgi:hypothetical protein
VNISSFIFEIFVICMVLQIILNAFLIPKLMDMYPEEYEKAGSPLWFWSDRRTLVFFDYILKGKYKSIIDRKLIIVFGISRVLIANILLFLLLFIVSIFL